MKSFSHRNVVKLFIFCELYTCSKNLNTNFTLGDCSLELCSYLRMLILINMDMAVMVLDYNARSQFSLPIVKCGKNVAVFKMDKSSSRYTDKKRYRSPWSRAN